LKIAIIGGTGLLGSNLVNLYNSLDYDVRAFSREHNRNVDITKNNIIDFNNIEHDLSFYYDIWRPDIIINTVANVNLHECENSYERAYYVNCQIATQIAYVASKKNIHYIHISTDHYYNDSITTHNETSDVVLLNNYAKTKFIAENNILKITSKALIVRTNIVGFRRRTAKSFFEWLLFSLQNKDEIELYSNFFTSPIDIKSLGNILILAYKNNLFGIYNIASNEVISKYNFGIKTAKKFNLSTEFVTKSEIKNCDTSIKRALTLGLDVSKIEKQLNISMPTINEVLDNLYIEYKKDKNE
jgi:dTDP-4-dehydrorhamnose reductase